jgi:hypothetical protein
LSSLPLASDLASALHVTALTSLKAFKSVSMHKNNLFEKALGMMDVRNLLWVTGQGRYALTRLRVPDLDGVVPASACYFCAVWAVNHRVDPAFRWDESARETTRQEKKIRQNWKKKISRIWVPGQRALRSVRLKKKINLIFF